MEQVEARSGFEASAASVALQRNVSNLSPGSDWGTGVAVPGEAENLESEVEREAHRLWAAELVSRKAKQPARPSVDFHPRSIAPFLPVRQEVLCTVFAHLPRAIGTHSKPFLELGSGDGRASIYAAMSLKVATVGLELDLVLIEQARSNAHQAGVGHLCEWLEEDISLRQWAKKGAWSCIFLHLLPQPLQELEPVLLDLGCPLICISFLLPTAKPVVRGLGWAIYNLPNYEPPPPGCGPDRAELLLG